MDPKLSGLDPKLKEAYDRVMSGPVAVPAGQSPMGAVPPTPTQQVSPPPQAPSPSFGVAPTQPVIPAEPAMSAAPSPTAGSTIAFNANDNQKNQGATVKHGGGSKLTPILMGLGILVFLVAYTFVWVFVFKLKIPFLPQ